MPIRGKHWSSPPSERTAAAASSIAFVVKVMLAKVEAALVPPPRKCLRVIIHEGDDEAAAKEKAKALAETVARAGGNTCGPLSARLDLKAPAVPRSDTDHIGPSIWPDRLASMPMARSRGTGRFRALS
jgi:hypothetical protein